MFTTQEKQQLEQRNLTLEEVKSQIEIFKEGLPFMAVENAATVGNGILQLSKAQLSGYADRYDKEIDNGLKPIKFIPASGAATRMFKALFEFVESGEVNKDVEQLLANIDHFAFGQELKKAVKTEDAIEVVKQLIEKEGMNYGQLPKGLLTFHKYNDKTRTPFEEHMVEGMNYCKQSNGDVDLHFTVSPDHQPLFEQLLEKLKAQYGEDDLNFNVSFSIQESSTDTIAVTPENEPFKKDGKLLFRPGGHGALIENLNKIHADLIFIKNIDNVVPDYRKEKFTTEYKKALAGLLLTIQKDLYRFQEIINQRHYSAIKSSELAEMVNFIQDKLKVKLPNDVYYWEKNELVPFLKMYINRPIRVCGMVRNEGEPGGGPYWVKQPDGSIGLQIVEASQINLGDEAQKALMQEATHFNPVDLVCATRNYQNKKFDLNRFIDPKTAFISEKTQNGKPLKALERPGLWNGAMAFWSTIFVEVPQETFAPVKTVNDLLRPEHQPAK
ncbi:DUF4301 family protein [Prolixibacteraceae bacterium JC049]|nr:DUF4301 family protein [Prolixibacteraceae bacterium JC049]